MYGLEGRTILVTGASGGIGGETVRQLVAAGADVIASGRNEAALGKLAESETGCRDARVSISTSEDSVRGALEGSTSGASSIAADSAARSQRRMETDIAVFDKVISINARGALLVTKYASRSMIRLGEGGSIVNVSSQAGAGRAAGPYLLRLVEGGARQHHPRLGAGARQT